MEKRILGIIFSLLGTAGLILAAISFVNGGGNSRNVKSIVIYSILGVIFFFAGVGLIKNTKDRPS
jgi:predicted Na+-dependent transporter